MAVTHSFSIAFVVVHAPVFTHSHSVKKVTTKITIPMTQNPSHTLLMAIPISVLLFIFHQPNEKNLPELALIDT